MSRQVFEMSTLNDKLNKFDARLEQSKLHDTSNNKFERKRQLWLSSCSQESGTSADATYGRWGQKSEKKRRKNTKKETRLIPIFCRAFVAPVLPNTRRTADDMRNLIDDI